MRDQQEQFRKEDRYNVLLERGRNTIFSYWVLFLMVYSFLSCTSNQEKTEVANKLSSTNHDTTTEREASLNTETQGPLFRKLPPQKTGIRFENRVEETPEFNNLTYPLMFNGGGVATGDINNDGLSDIFLTGNMVSSRLYLNEGDMQFQDITESAGVGTDRWITGVSMIDINNDGNLDVYLSAASPEDAPADKRANLLYINNGNNTFTEKAAEYNIADTNHTTQALFCDYDKDGWLDLFLLNHSPGTFSRDMNGGDYSRNASKSYDKLYKNNGDSTFTDVTTQAEILQSTGYGLGAVTTDVNRDGWPDIYVSNDISPDDVLYINNRDGTFSDRSKDFLKHTSFAGMGLDIADFNMDGWPDIMQADMMPPDYQKRKRMSYGVNYEQFANKIARGYNYSYTKNTLQMNNGLDAEGNLVFSEIGRMAGVAYTNWSWAALFGDYDNDGYKDIMITNGYPKATNDFDYLVEQHANAGSSKAGFNTRYQIYQELNPISIPNYLFENKGALMFSDVSQQWGFTDSTYSYGAAHADLNNDGALDLVINNLNAKASLYQNNARQESAAHYLSITLEGSSKNRMGLGADVVLHYGGKKQYAYHTLYRGYQSSVDPRIHFGVGQVQRIDSLEVFWPDGRYQILTDVKADQQLTVNYAESIKSSKNKLQTSNEEQIFSEISAEVNLIHRHRENRFNDYQIQPLLHRQLSKMGPKVAAGDITGNGLDDIYIGGASGYPGTLYLQNSDGSFEKENKNQPWLRDQSSEDMGAVFFDANGDGLLDLYVASGGYEFSPAEDAILDRLYINAGNGQFIKDESALPQMYTSSSEVVPGDYDGDGDHDLFVGGRLIPFKYPYPARSYLLENDNGTFTDVTSTIAPELVEPGLITDALWTDFNEDGRLDLVTAGIWMPVQFYENADGSFQEVTRSVVEGPATNRGWWYSLAKGDFNNDGRIDIVAGNQGLNHTFRISEKKKFGVYARDFSNDLTTDIIHTIDEEDVQYPFFGKGRLGRALGFINAQYPTYESFSKASLSDLFNEKALNSALHYQVNTFASLIFLNQGEGAFDTEQLPEQAQVSPIQGMVPHDVDGDRQLDLIMGGNIFATHPDISRADAGNGLWLRGDGAGGFKPVPASQSGLYAPGDVKDLKLITIPGGKALLIANNDAEIQLFQIRK